MSGEKGWVLVTGASRGIGAGVAVALAKAGHDLILWARNEVDLKEVGNICERHGSTAITALVDVTDPDTVFGAGAASVAAIPSLRGCVVNAGIGIWGSIEALGIDEWREVIATNLDGAFYTLKLAGTLLEKCVGAQVLTMGSDSSLTGLPERGAYCASKWGLQGLTETFRRENRHKGIRVTNLIMSRVDTYFREKSPGTRPASLKIERVGEVVDWLFSLPVAIEVRELHVSAMTSSFGVFPEYQKEQV